MIQSAARMRQFWASEGEFAASMSRGGVSMHLFETTMMRFQLTQRSESASDGGNCCSLA
jgi:hypothetical protein